jgi:hypothetical protein
MSLIKFDKTNITNIIKENDKLLTIEELLSINNYEINKLYFDKFWNSIKDNIDIYINDNTLTYMGYKCEEIKNNKAKYINLLK